jgi:hypothetical protein
MKTPFAQPVRPPVPGLPDVEALCSRCRHFRPRRSSFPEVGGRIRKINLTFIR